MVKSGAAGMMPSIPCSIEGAIAMLKGGGQRGRRSKVLRRKVETGETLAWCVLLRLP